MQHPLKSRACKLCIFFDHSEKTQQGVDFFILWYSVLRPSSLSSGLSDSSGLSSASKVTFDLCRRTEVG